MGHQGDLSEGRRELFEKRRPKGYHPAFVRPQPGLRNSLRIEITSAGTRWRFKACAAAYALKFGEDAANWGNTALLHDFHWRSRAIIEKGRTDPPEAACPKRSAGPSCRSKLHGWRVSPLEKALFACDELQDSSPPVSP
jgi:hypothetical protein